MSDFPGNHYHYGRKLSDFDTLVKRDLSGILWNSVYVWTIF